MLGKKKKHFITVQLKKCHIDQLNFYNSKTKQILKQQCGLCSNRLYHLGVGAKANGFCTKKTSWITISTESATLLWNTVRSTIPCIVDRTVYLEKIYKKMWQLAILYCEKSKNWKYVGKYALKNIIFYSWQAYIQNKNTKKISTSPHPYPHEWALGYLSFIFFQ